MRQPLSSNLREGRAGQILRDRPSIVVADMVGSMALGQVVGIGFAKMEADVVVHREIFSDGLGVGIIAPSAVCEKSKSYRDEGKMIKKADCCLPSLRCCLIGFSPVVCR